MRRPIPRRKAALRGHWRWLLIPLLFLAGCHEDEGSAYQPQFSDRPAFEEQVYVFGVHPLHNPERLFAVYQPLVDHVNHHLGTVRLKLEASRNYAAYEEKLYAGAFHFALPNPYQVINALKHDYRVFGKMGDDHNFRGIILVRRDSGIHEVSDLKGKAVSYPAPTALAATMMPQWFLHTHGLNIAKDIDNRYVGSQESSIMNAFLGTTVAASTWPPPWRAFSKERPELAEQMEIRWQTDPLVNNGLVVRRNIPEEHVAAIASLLFSLHTHPEGQTILAAMELSRFEKATDATYEPVKTFLSRFEKEVRPIQEPP
ncbi:MAG: phosphate/phosphite/phosphonate ABC transporter substrate-binding protein [Magnetococcales bacterium]|nr:phosphate/phosphite/phosphonate ABC transporter substrate-binding protein [Magnetococcales bacterium]